MPIRDYLHFVRRGNTDVLRDEFFSTNVREFAGSNTPVNSAIRRTLSSDSETAFWWMNNGITIITDRITYQSDDSWMLVNPQIVNGLQTTNVIHEASTDKAITTKRLKEGLLVRVISELNPALRESIIQGTNNQTQVNQVQLYANDELQVDIETFLETKQWFYERRRWQFRNRPVSRSRIRSILDLAQVIIAGVLLEPDTARARPRDRFKSEAQYRRVFNSKVPMKLYATLLDTQEAIENYLRSDDACEISTDLTNDRFYVLTGVCLRMSGVKDRGTYSATVLNSHLEVPTSAVLKEVHQRLYALVDPDAEKKERDKMFKGAKLRDNLIADILAWNDE